MCWWSRRHCGSAWRNWKGGWGRTRRTRRVRTVSQRRPTVDPTSARQAPAEWAQGRWAARTCGNGRPSGVSAGVVAAGAGGSGGGGLAGAVSALRGGVAPVPRSGGGAAGTPPTPTSGYPRTAAGAGDGHGIPDAAGALSRLWGGDPSGAAPRRPGALWALVARLFAAWHAARNDPTAWEQLPQTMPPIQDEFRTLLETGQASTSAKAAGLCRALLSL